MKKRLAVLLCLMLFGGTIIGNSVEASAASVVSGTYVKSDNEHNPLVTQNYGADPGVMVYNDTVYIYTTNDSQELTGNNENTYGKITTLNCYSSKDMVNWTDHGSFNVAGSNGAAKWASNSWAPCITSKRINGKDKFFLYFANNTGAAVDGWTLTIPTDQLSIDSAWNVNVKKSVSNYVITPVDWNRTIQNGQAVEFGCIGNGSIGDTINLEIN